MLRFCLVSCSLLAYLLHPPIGISGAAGDPSASVHGVVSSEATNQRIPHATVWLCDDGGNRMHDSLTNDSGEFAFLGLNAGAYTLKVSAAGYDPVELPVAIDFSNERGISVFLKPARTSTTKVANGSSISAHELSMPEAARKLMESGKRKLYADKNQNGALEDFQSAVGKAPGFYEAYYQIGMAYLSLQNFQQAESNLQKSADLSLGHFADADIALATLLLNRRDTSRGEPLLRRGLELNPNSWMAQFELGKLELYRNHLEPALQAGDKARSLAPEQAVIHRLLSLIHLRQKNYPAALADLDAYIRLDPDSPEGVTARKIRLDTRKLLEKPQTAAVDNSKPK